MSGPIVRKYGFPNFEKIFGERELQHGVDEAEGAAPVADSSEPTQDTSKVPAAKKSAAKPKKKKS